eukprot:11163737-Lingulodinium_polyedra.AAC.1
MSVARVFRGRGASDEEAAPFPATVAASTVGATPKVATGKSCIAIDWSFRVTKQFRKPAQGMICNRADSCGNSHSAG